MLAGVNAEMRGKLYWNSADMEAKYERLRKREWKMTKRERIGRSGEEAMHVPILCCAPISIHMKPLRQWLSTAVPRTQDTNGLQDKGVLALTLFDLITV